MNQLNFNSAFYKNDRVYTENLQFIKRLNEVAGQTLLRPIDLKILGNDVQKDEKWKEAIKNSYR